MTRLVEACPVTWAAVNNVVYHGTIPGFRVVEAMARVTGFSAKAIVEGCERAHAERRELAA